MTSEFWPDDVRQLAMQRELLIVVGSGVSQASRNLGGRRPPSWADLLRQLSEVLPNACRDEVVSLIESSRLLDAAELLNHLAELNSRRTDVRNKLRTAVDGAPGQLFEGNQWHDAIVRLEPRTIVTTNYDKILERATRSGYAVHTYDSMGIASDVRKRVPTLIKIHGTIDNIDDVVLSRTDYTRLRVAGRHALETLQALFLTRTALFVGYSLHDPDIRLLLENAVGGARGEPPHYILGSDAMPLYERNVLRYCYGVNLIQYQNENYEQALAGVIELADLVQSAAPSADTLN